jgi:hypothetical protein
MESRGVQYAVAAAALFGLSTPAAKLLLADFSALMLSPFSTWVRRQRSTRPGWTRA